MEAINDVTMENASIAAMKIPKSAVLAKNISYLGAPVRSVVFIVPDENSAPNTSIHINITKSGIRKFKNTGKTVSENSALPVILTPIKLPASVHITAEIKVAIRQSTIATLTFLRPAVFLISASSAFLNPVIKLHLAQIIILQ